MAIAFRIQSVFLTLCRASIVTAALLFVLHGCGGGGGDDPPPPPEGYKLTVSGGTLNDGVNPAGLVVLATLRDSDSRGPGGMAGWEITITGPGIVTPLIVDYDDGSASSYMSWVWDLIPAEHGIYTATATDGTTTLSATFSVDNGLTLPQPSLDKTGDVISWSVVDGAGSYYYRVVSGSGTIADSGYLAANETSFVLKTLPDGDYVIEVFAHTKDRYELMTDPSPTPVLSLQENIALSTLPYLVSGSGTGFFLQSRGGVIYMGKDELGDDQYALAIWTSILTAAGDRPASAWTVTVTGPGLAAPLTFTYPASNSHYIYWDFGPIPEAGLYEVTATGSGDPLIESFTIQNLTAQLPIVTGLAKTQDPGEDVNVSWNPAPGASSYYVNVWECVGGTLTAEKCIDGIYTEIAGGWVNTSEALILASALTPGTPYDVYVTACELDMTTMDTTPPPDPGTQVDMSDPFYAPLFFTAQ